VEFAIVALPFTALILGTIELGMIFLVATTLDNATQNMTRAIRTGAFQSSGGKADDLKTKICNNLGWLQGDCMSNLYLDVRTYGQFSDIVPVQPVTNGAFDPSKIQFQVGASGDIVVVRAFYLWTVFAPGVSSGLQTLSDGKTLVQAAAFTLGVALYSIDWNRLRRRLARTPAVAPAPSPTP